jgi:hypothetical protein
VGELILLLGLWSMLAMGAPPDDTPVRLEVGIGKIERMVISDDGRLLVGRSRNELDAWLLDVEDWSLQRYYVCDEVTGLALIPTGDGGQQIWMSCGDGTIRALSYKDGVLDSVLDPDGNPVTIQVAETLSGIWYHETGDVGLLYVLTVAEEPSWLHVFDPASFYGDSDVLAGYPAAMAYSDFVEGLVVNNTLYVAHGGDNLSEMMLGVPNGTVIPSTPAAGMSIKDISPSPSGSVYGIDDSGILAEYVPGSRQFQTLLTSLGEPNAVVWSGDFDDDWLLVLGWDIYVWPLVSGLIQDSNPSLVIPGADNKVQDAVARDGYVFGGGEGGFIHLTTARPWVYPESLVVSVSEATNGEVFDLSFAADEPGDWEVFRGGDRFSTGTPVAWGTTIEIAELATAQISVDLNWDEGNNDLYVVYTNPARLTGHARTGVLIDNPPRPPTLTDSNVGFGDQMLSLHFEGIPDVDLAYYDVFVTTTSFSGSDWPTGGPAWDGPTSVTAPIRVDAVGGQSVEINIQPLTNGVLHYIAVRATDQGGLEGPMSNVVKGRPRPNYSASDLAGEPGGTPWAGTAWCSTSGGAMAGWLALMGAFLVGWTRRSTSLLALCFAAALASPGTSDAKEGNHDMTPQRGDFEIRYGVLHFSPQVNGDPNALSEVYKDSPTNILQLEFGPQIGRVLEFDLGFGFLQELAWRVDARGRQSTDRSMMTMFPLALDSTVRLHFWDEQILVPFARYGFDYVLYTELTDDGSGGKDKLQGAKIGHHIAGGVNILLDVFSQNRASLLEATSGINDTYLTIEFRKQNVDQRRYPASAPVKYGLDFTASMVTVGLKLDY